MAVKRFSVSEVKTDLILFADAIDVAFPKDCTRDRYNRFIGPRNTEPLQQLAIKYRDFGVTGAIDTQEQAGMVARAIMKALRKA